MIYSYILNDMIHKHLVTKYLRKTKASPATNLFELTNVLHPVVSRCLRGCPNIYSEGEQQNIKSSDKSMQATVEATSKYVLKSPLEAMKIFCNQILGRGSLSHVLQRIEQITIRYFIQHYETLSSLRVNKEPNNF